MISDNTHTPARTLRKSIRAALFVLVFAAILLAQTTHSVTITEPCNTSGDPVTTYNVLRGITSGGESSTPIGTVPATACTAGAFTYIDNAVTGGTTYFYEVTATNSGGTSAPSPEVSVTVPFFPPNTPAKPTATAK